MASAYPFVKPQFFTSAGKPLAGGKLWSYLAGTNTPAATFTDSGGLTPNPNPVILDSAGRADIWLQPGSYKFVMMDANDVILWTKDHVKPADGGGGGIVDSDYVFDAWSLRFTEQFTSSGLLDTLTKIIQPGYSVPTIALSGSSNVLREKGDSISGITLTANIGKKSYAISNVKFYRGATLLDEQTSGGGIPSGGNSTYTYGSSFSDTTSFTAKATDTAGPLGGPTEVTSNTLTYSFVYPYFVGAGATGLSAASVAGLTKRIIASTTSRTETISASAGNVFYFAYPASYGALTSILDVNNFETLPDWTLRTENITGLDGNAVSYRIYEFKNPVTAGSYQYTFKR